MAQLLKHYDDLTDRDLKQMRFPAYVQKKEDGVYAEVGVAGTYSRQGRAFYIPVEVQNQIRIPNYHLVAELICPGLSLEELSGLVNPNRTKPWEDYQIDHFHEHARYVYHDMISSTAVLQGFCALPYKNRLEALHNAVSSTDIVQTGTINSFNEVDEYYETAVQLGWEGIVLKQMHGIWHNGSRNFDQVKETDIFVKDEIKVKKETKTFECQNQACLLNKGCKCNNDIVIKGIEPCHGRNEVKPKKNEWKTIY